MGCRRTAIGLWLALTVPSWAHDTITTKITWTQEISRIVASRCLACHGAESSVSFASYAEARPWAKAIRDQVLSRQMPPWGAVNGVGNFRNDPSLTEAERERVVQWVEGGAPEGDPAYLPRARQIAKAPPYKIHASLRITGTYTLPRSVSCHAIRPDSPLEAIALLPSGRVEHLIWLREYHALTYVFLEPLLLPKGTSIYVTRGAALLDLAPPSAVALH